MKKKFLFLAVAVVLGGIILLFLAELYVRLFSRHGYITPEIIKGRSLEYVPSVFSRYVFPQKAFDPSGYKGARYQINSRGYRGPEFNLEKPEGALRIIFYGGSAVFDQAVTEPKEWPRRVERILKQSGFPQVEVINAGVPGSDTFDSLGRFYSEGHLFRPDYAVLSNQWNDFEYFRSHEPILRQFQPYLAGMDPRLNYQNRLDKFLCEHSQLFNRVRLRYYNFQYRVGPEGAKPKGKLGNEITPEALRQYKIDLELFCDLARNIGATPVLMLQPRLVSPDNTEADKKRIAYDYALLTHDALVQAFADTDQILRQAAAEKSAVLLDAARELNGRNDLFIDHVHLNDRGSEALAKIVAAEMERILRPEAQGAATVK